MKLLLTFIFLLCSGMLSAQELTCLQSDLYDPYDDLEKIKSDSNDKPETNLLKTDSLQIIVMPDSYSDFSQYSSKKRNGVDKGFKVIVINNSIDVFNAHNMDRRILFVRQVYYNDQWITIKPYVNMFYGFCGNSFMTDALLQPGTTHNYIAACLEGTEKARFRLVMAEKNGKKVVYSNEFTGYLDTRLLGGK